MSKVYSCGALRAEHTGETVTVKGWVNRRRDLGQLIFIDLRDRSGMVQLAFDPQISEQAHKLAEAVRSEYVLAATGVVRKRPEGTENPKLSTGEIEISVTGLEILNPAKPLPF